MEILKSKNKIMLATIILLLIITGILVYQLKSNKNNKDITKSNEVIALETSVENEEKETKEKTIKIDIKGAVTNPGVYELNESARVIDAINAAGGLTKYANTRYINLSKTLNDNDVIIVNTTNEIKEMLNKNEPKECICEPVNTVCITDEKIITSEIEEKEDKTIATTNNEISSKININTATIDILKTLNGIGDAKAKSIIEYRTSNGNFNSVEDLKKVTGISDAIYDKIKENITV